MWYLLYFIIIIIGLKVPEYYSMRLGCYHINNASVYKKVTFRNNNGTVCLEYCSKTARTQYAGTSGKLCFCMGEIEGWEANGWDCDMPCPDLTYDEVCGETISQTVEQTTEATTNPPLHQPNSTTSTHSNQTKVITESNEQHTANLSAELFSVQSTSPPTLTLSTSNISTMKPVRHVVSSSEILHLKTCVIVCCSGVLCSLIINNVAIYMCRKYKNSKKGSNKQADNYGYIRPVDVTNMVDACTLNNTRSFGNDTARHFEENNVYHYVESSINENHYDDSK